MMKTFLKGHDGSIFALAPKATTIGQENCNLIIQMTGVESQHALIEYCEEDGCYVLQDLNTVQGTYINGVCVQNAAVRLAHGDCIQFGYNGLLYKLHVQFPPQVNQTKYSLSHQQCLPSLCSTNQTFPRNSGLISRQQLTFTNPGLKCHPYNVIDSHKSTFDIYHIQPPVTSIGLQISQSDWNSNAHRECSITASSNRNNGSNLITVRDLKDVGTQLHTHDVKDSAPQEGTTAGVCLQELQTSDTASPNIEKSHLVSTVHGRLGSVSDEQEMNEYVGRRRAKAKLKTDLERAKKDNSSISTLLTQMQHDLLMKDSSIGKLAQEVEMQKKEIKEYSRRLSIANVKILEASSNGNSCDEREAREKELIGLRQKFKCAEGSISDQYDAIRAMKEEMTDCRKLLDEERTARSAAQQDADVSRTKLIDTQHAEHRELVNLKQRQKDLEQMRSLLVQAVCSMSSLAMPETELTDDELMGMAKEGIAEHTELRDNMVDLRRQLNDAVSKSSSLESESDKLREAVDGCLCTMKSKGWLMADVKELSVTATSNIQGKLSWISDVISDLVSMVINWRDDIQAVLVKCGIDCSLSTDCPGFYIEKMLEKLEAALDRETNLLGQISDLTTFHQHELQAKLNAQHKDLSQEHLSMLENVREEGETKLGQAVEEVRKSEQERLQGVIVELKTYIEELKANVDRLKEDQTKLDQLSELKDQIECYQAVESKLKQELHESKVMFGQQQQEQEALCEQYEERLTSYKLQVHQHSITICCLDKQANELRNSNMELQATVTSLTSNNAELLDKMKKISEQKAAFPPRPRIIVHEPADIGDGLEDIRLLRYENGVLKKIAKEQDGIISGLRRDLSGVSARLSDASGELNESQKLHVEKNVELVRIRDSEVAELQKDNSLLSTTVDQQKEQIHQLEEKLGKVRDERTTSHNALDENRQLVDDLQVRLEEERLEQRKQLKLFDEQRQIKSELVNIGTECRGKRHEHIIARQKEAISELRSRLKAVGHPSPSLKSNHLPVQNVTPRKGNFAVM